MTAQTKYINPFTDFGFKRIFGEEDNKDILVDFLNEVLAPQGIVIKELNYKKNDHYPISAEDRKVIFDLYCENENGDKFTIELQKAKQDNFKDRMLYYSTFSIQEQGKKGNWNYKLKAVYVIAILDFVFENSIKDKVISYTKLLDIDTKKAFSDNLNFVTIEMPHFTKEEHELETNLDKWLYLLRHLHELENIPVKLQGKILEKVFKIAEYSALSKSARREYDESLKNLNDLQNTLETADKDGFERGVKNMIPKVEEALKQKEEAEQSLKKMIKKMIARNFTIQEIAEDLGKSEAEINAIIKEN